MNLTVPNNAQALVDICHKVLQAVHKNPSSRAVKKGSTVTMDEGGGAKSSKDGEKPFDSMNSIVANMLLNMTRSAFTTSPGFCYNATPISLVLLTVLSSWEVQLLGE